MFLYYVNGRLFVDDEDDLLAFVDGRLVAGAPSAAVSIPVLSDIQATSITASSIVPQVDVDFPPYSGLLLEGGGDLLLESGDRILI